MNEAIEALARQGTLIAYFGYGSLVNRATHRTDSLGGMPARLHGWRRAWRPQPEPGEVAASLLTVMPDEHAHIDGFLVFDHARNLPSVDEREAHYHRHTVELSRLDVPRPIPDGCPVYVYEAKTAHPVPDSMPPILQSYLDAVLQGFYAEYGEAGVEAFVRATENFETPVLRDRHAPRYPRAVQLSEAERALFDRLLTERGVVYLSGG